MSKYYKHLQGQSKLNVRSGAAAIVPAGFRDLSSLIISRCSFLQSQIQRVIYVTHGAEILAARTVLRSVPQPKRRIEFLTSFPYSEEDPVVYSAFNYSRQLFNDIYELRNVLAHELWMSTEEHNKAVLFSRLDEEERLLMASSRLLHTDDATSREIYDATIRYIQSVKLVSQENLQAAVKDADLCAWILMNITNIIDADTPIQKDEARRAFFVFKGTSHLFSETTYKFNPVSIESLRNKTIRD